MDLLLQPELRDFITKHEADDETKLLLQHKSVLGLPAKEVVQQIVGRRKAKLKLPRWYANHKIIFPPAVNLEQSSSEATAFYKAELMNEKDVAANRVADLTGGFGVDSFFLSLISASLDYVESNEELLHITKHNHSVLTEAAGSQPIIHHHHTTAEKFLDSTQDRFDLIYIDPSRREKGGQKIFRFGDCLPNVVQLQERIFSKTTALLVKASPLMDLQMGASELRFVKEIFVVAVDNECKEVLFLCGKNFDQEARITAIDLSGSGNYKPTSSFSFYASEEKKVISSFSPPLTYLYEPNAALLKSGAFKLTGMHHQLHKLHQHTHLYTSSAIDKNFPGRIFKVEALVKPDAKILRQHFPEGKANVVTRNYPLTSEQLKKKTGLKDGGDKFLIAFSGSSEKFVAVCSRVDPTGTE